MYDRMIYHTVCTASLQGATTAATLSGFKSWHRKVTFLSWNGSKKASNARNWTKGHMLQIVIVMIHKKCIYIYVYIFFIMIYSLKIYIFYFCNETTEMWKESLAEVPNIDSNRVLGVFDSFSSSDSRARSRAITIILTKSYETMKCNKDTYMY